MSLKAHTLTGSVVSAGRMAKAVSVRIARQEYDKKFQKYFRASSKVLASDLTESCRQGDIVEITKTANQVSPSIKHFVSKIVTPFGPPIEARPRVMTEDQRNAVIWRRKLDRYERCLNPKRERAARILRAKLSLPARTMSFAQESAMYEEEGDEEEEEEEDEDEEDEEEEEEEEAETQPQEPTGKRRQKSKSNA